MHLVHVSCFIALSCLLRKADAIFETFECIGCQPDVKVIFKYQICHTMLPSRIRKKGEECIKKLTKSTDLFEQWSQICSSRDMFYQIYLCTDILEGGPGGEEEQEEKKRMLKYISCVYKLKERFCLNAIKRYIRI
ncbi:hypothetical protein TNCT_635721 [Trichonephila clavata]|uniref:Uncharacterized protein n=1 Tax=Trichonephila clavata TaxID=2740835 RepID=A0A8X6GEU3_TRICU|nr:hypothetical protein TNCT_635721 [Trichonephila clavata]